MLSYPQLFGYYIDCYQERVKTSVVVVHSKILAICKIRRTTTAVKQIQTIKNHNYFLCINCHELNKLCHAIYDAGAIEEIGSKNVSDIQIANIVFFCPND